MEKSFRVKLSTMLFGLSLFSSSHLSASVLHNAETNISIPRTNKIINVDGVIDEAAWRHAKKFTINNITYPQENKRSPVKTEALVIEDGGTLYVAFKAFDPNPEEIRAVLSDRDKNWNDDLVGIKIDSFNDHALAYQFFINPLGTQTDSIENELTGRESSAWNGIWDSAGTITEDGYIVEVAIPLRILNFNDSLDMQKWGFELIRFYPRDEKYRISNMSVDQGNHCWVCQMPTIEGFEGAKQGKNLTVVPTFVSGLSQSREITSDSTPPIIGEWEDTTNTQVGLDVKWGITPDITLNATINPDFSQVEADSGQLNVNNTFALFTPEKRSFFLANEDYFKTPVDLVYTRNIQAPSYGGKVTGKLEEHSFAAFVADDESSLFLLPGNLGSNLYEIEDETTNAAFRYNVMLNDDWNVGATSTIRENSVYHNYLTSVDTKFQPDDNNRLDIQIMHSDTYLDELYVNDIANSGDYSDEQALRAADINGTDTAYRIDYSHNNKDWFFRASHFNIGEAFRADLAFFNNTDNVKSVLGGGRIWRGDESNWWTRFEIQGDIDQTSNQAGEKIEEEAEIFVNLRAPMQSFIRNGLVVRNKVGNRIDTSTLAIDGNTEMYKEKEFRSWMEFRPVSNIWLGNFLKVGENLDYANSRLSDVFVFEPRVNFNIGKHLETRISYKYNTMEYGGDTVFTANLLDLRMNYQFNIRSFLRLSIVGFDIERNLENYKPEVRDDYTDNYKSVAGQLLFSYKVNPQTLFFIGYSEGGYQIDELSKLTSDNRSVFLKMSYAWIM